MPKEPMMETFSFDRRIVVIPGRCQTKNTWGYQKAKPGKKSQYAKAMEWEGNAKAHVTAQLLEWGYPIPLIPRGPVVMSVKVVIEGEKRGDLQNYFKSVCDAMQKILYTNDAQIELIGGVIGVVGEKIRNYFNVVTERIEGFAHSYEITEIQVKPWRNGGYVDR